MYSVDQPRDFVDYTDLDIESEWNPQYQDSPVLEANEPDWFDESTPGSPADGFMYECAFCLHQHSPSSPCNGSNYTFKLPQSASHAFGYEPPVYRQEPVERSNGIIQSNYRKWLVSVTPR
ncbi:hypothetical protein FT663_03428 [Candidozyma haemuli var. vulneris]|uniref:Uncharacterized protein n=1 Tax=Candidozyma haemuli TaxID=45357 RepID=A0A2V1AZF6_9ASCO|nr:hypothetical protein CXQ85_002965 [[Candida] haemuloni]KAF3989857.1 hypothetical protein FT663_03428 [[Candida] haemuloni var. vulneris]KAF3991399.1 hypothetical protein FT662_01754 [[Candida] haemuloni var. vulneris]PVH23235.1 hypothetical protein CXQ85_002965 [[Candida] haemuloni]